MKITRKKLEQIIKEEINYALLEESVVIDEAFGSRLKNMFNAALLGAGMLTAAGSATPAHAADHMIKVDSGKKDGILPMDDHGDFKTFVEKAKKINQRGGIDGYKIIQIDGKDLDKIDTSVSQTATGAPGTQMGALKTLQSKLTNPIVIMKIAKESGFKKELVEPEDIATYADEIAKFIGQANGLKAGSATVDMLGQTIRKNLGF